MSGINRYSVSMFSGSRARALNERVLVNSEDAFEDAMFKSTGNVGFGLYAHGSDEMTFYHSADPYSARMYASLAK